jgi:hypothetical protein
MKLYPRTAALLALCLPLAASAARPRAAHHPAAPGQTAPERLQRLELDVFVPNVTRGELLPLRVLGWSPAGERRNVTQLVRWSVSPPQRGSVDNLDRFEGREPGPARITATYSSGLSASADIDVLSRGEPDWAVTYIERLPRAEFDRSGSEPKPGELIQWCGHVKNYGTASADPVRVEWRVDGKTVRAGQLPRLERWASTELLLSLKADGQPHDVELIVDPEHQAPETSERNNAVTVSSDSLPAGFWVEESTYRYFHLRQRELGDGSNCWEDWAQRQVRFWNRSREKGGRHAGRYPWRVDRIVVVRDGMLPLAGGSPTMEPDRRDRTVCWMRGFPAAYLRDCTEVKGRNVGNRFFVDPDLLPPALVRR